MELVPTIIGRLGRLTTRLAVSEHEVEAAQRLRFNVFSTEMGARLNPAGAIRGLDADAFDPLCRHLLVLDGDDIVGTYRIRLDTASEQARFYSSGQFDLAPLLAARAGETLMELGRSCIARPYRSRRTMELLWHGAWHCALAGGATTLFGCASLPGSDPAEHRETLGWLASNRLLEVASDCPPRGSNVALANRDAGSAARPPALPPLLKGYLRLGARLAGHAVPDEAFGTTDVLVVLDVGAINPRYLAHYGADASRFSSRGTQEAGAGAGIPALLPPGP